MFYFSLVSFSFFILMSVYYLSASALLLFVNLTKNEMFQFDLITLLLAFNIQVSYHCRLLKQQASQITYYRSAITKISSSNVHSARRLFLWMNLSSMTRTKLAYVRRFFIYLLGWMNDKEFNFIFTLDQAKKMGNGRG